jgi:hypothetical protein
MVVNTSSVSPNWFYFILVQVGELLLFPSFFPHQWSKKTGCFQKMIPRQTCDCIKLPTQSFYEWGWYICQTKTGGKQSPSAV